mgnify:CR=1 FL=1
MTAFGINVDEQQKEGRTEICGLDLPADVDVAAAGDIVPELTGILWYPVLHVDLVLLSQAPVSVKRPRRETGGQLT